MIMTSATAEPAPRGDARRLLLNVAAQDQRRLERTAALRRAGYMVVEAASESQAIGAVVHRDVALVELTGRLRPKERRPLSVTVNISSRTCAAGITLEWSIAPLPSSLTPAARL